MSTTTKPAGTPVRILVAEDSPTQAQRLQHLLEQQGYHVTIAANGRAALEAPSSAIIEASPHSNQQPG